MISELVRVIPAAIAVGVIPGWFWARTLSGSTDLAENCAYSIALSLSLVSGLALAEVRIFGTGLTLALAVAAVAVVFASGLAAYLLFGPVKDRGVPTAPRPAALDPVALAPLALALVLGSDFASLGAYDRAVASCWGWLPACYPSGDTQRFLVPVAALIALSGVMQVWSSGQTAALQPDGMSAPEEEAAQAHEESSEGWSRRLLLGAVLVLVLARGYSGVVLHDWPFIRGVDNYSHAVMADMMLSTGDGSSYLIYPPGFHLLAAEISRLSGIEPLNTFPVMAPLMLLAPALCLYALGRRMWGWEAGVAAAFFGSFLAGGIYYYFDDAMYPNLTAAQILLVMAVCSLIALYARAREGSGAALRGGLVFALIGSGVVLYHQVSSLYLAVLLVLVAVIGLPYLFFGRYRKEAGVLFLSLVALAVLSVAYAWDTYDIPRVIAHVLGGASGGKTANAVKMAIGTQRPYGFRVLIGAVVSQPVAWLGFLGVVLVVGQRRRSVPQTLAYATVLLWLLEMAVGSSTSLDGFPQRFGRDLGVPLSLFAGVASWVILRSLMSRRRPLPIYAASVVVLLSGALVGLRSVQSMDQAAGPSPEVTMTPQIAQAGKWLKEHNTGGNIMVSPQSNQVPSRMMLAMGHYHALQSFTAPQVAYPRDLPPDGPKPYWDVLWVMGHPQAEKTREILKHYDVRYVVLYKREPDRPVVPYWRLFERYPELYRTVFENRDVLIVAPRHLSR